MQYALSPPFSVCMYTVNLVCSKRVDDDQQSLVVSCSSDRDLTVLCSLNSSPFQPCVYISIQQYSLFISITCGAGTLPWKVAFTPPTRDYNLEINVTDSLNLKDSYSITHTGTALVIEEHRKSSVSVCSGTTGTGLLTE